MSDFSWLFWILVVFLFAESWARVWASAHRGEEPPASGDLAPPQSNQF
ncbi:MAG: hypothetical protein JSU87_16110 [Gemmatimonadota bacterium]|nr:MAG: hypothetical protein JSU87_16110 [Gemmatimonadota bacterium]